jgi:glutamine synthetase
MYTDPLPASEVRRLPMNLLDALRALSASEALVKALGTPFIDAYIKLKEREWHEHNAQISAFERQTTLDC